MKIEGSVQEFKELFKNFKLKEENKTPVGATTDVNITLDGKKIISHLDNHD